MSLPYFFSFTKQWHSEPYESISPSRPALSMASKNVVVTGAGSGIGRSIAISFAEAGASSLALLGRRAERLESTAQMIAARAPETTVTCIQTDVTKREQVEWAFTEVTTQVGQSHILVISAGVLPAPSPTATASPETLQSIFATNVFGALNTAQTFLSHAAPEPVLLNINSGLSHMAPLRSMGVYAASKAANAKLFDYLALENPQLHLVNVQPGVVDTEMNGCNGDIELDAPDKAELPGHFCVWLTSPEAKFLRGKFVWVNWDVDELKARADEIARSRLLTTSLEGVPM